jgi:acetoin utilization deacetylase AcuC-like enzyme
VRVAVVTDPVFAQHVASPAHPERPERLDAVAEGIAALHLDTDLVEARPRPATTTELRRVHDQQVLDIVHALHERGGGAIDADTAMSERSRDAAEVAAGAGLTAVEALRAGAAEVAFCAVRPPGHHATAGRSMGFCLYNNVAVTAAALAEVGERVVIIDIDAHHGNGTEDIFLADSRVLYISLHQWPLYPGTGRHDEVGVDAGRGTNVNVPVPPGATGDVYLEAWDEILEPAIDRFAPTWLLVSAGFDADRRDPLTQLGLSAGDFADLGHRLTTVVPHGRTVLFLEGGYDLQALSEGSTALLGAFVDEDHRAQHATSGGPGREQVALLARWWETVGAERING